MECPKCQFENAPEASFCSKCGTNLSAPDNIPIFRTQTYETPIEELSTGSSFAGRYQIIEELGRGGMGKVYKAFDKEISAKIAIKLIKPEVAGDKTTIDRFRNELKLARDVSSKHICRMYDLNKIGNAYYITMEYVQGEDLKRIMSKIGLLSAGQAISIARQVCEGLSEAHKLGIVHRDLKPSNIMIDNNGNVRIMDFGIARSIKTKGITDSGVIIGTPEYMSPEQFEGRAPDARSDIYSLGIVLFEMLTGTLPFEGDTPLAIGLKQKTENPKEPRKLNPQIPDELNQLILKCLEKLKEARYQNADEVLSELLRMEKRIPTSKRIVPVRKPITSREISFHVNLRNLIIPGVLLVLAGIVVTAALVKKSASTLSTPISKYEQVTYTKSAFEPTISPDGRSLAFVRREPEKKDDLVVQDLDTGQQLSVLSREYISNIDWLPNGSELSYWDGKGSWDFSGRECVISRFGGTPRGVASGGASESLIAWAPESDRYASGGGWSTGTICIKDRSSNIIQSIPFDLRGSVRWYVSVLDWSPDGNSLLLLTVGNQTKSAIWMIDLRTRQSQELVEQKDPIVSAKWSSKGDAVYYLLSQNLAKELWKVTLSSRTKRPTGPPVRLLAGFEGGAKFSIPRSRNSLFITYELPSWDLWQVAWTKRQNSFEPSASKIASSTLEYGAPSISPDRKYVACSKGDSKVANIFIIPTSGGHERQLTKFNSYSSRPVWSPDGKAIAFISNEGGLRSVWKVEIENGVPVRYEHSKLDTKSFLLWLPGKELLYASPLHWQAGLGLYSAVSGKPIYEDKGDYSFVSNYAFFEPPHARANWDPFMLVYSVDGQKIGGFGARKEKQGTPSCWGYLVISLKDKSQKFIETKDSFPIGLSEDGMWVYLRKRSSSRDDLLFSRINLETGREENVLIGRCSIDGRPYMGDWSPRTEVLVIPGISSDIWEVENFDPAIR